jgi:hypothetical protein
MTLPRIPFTRPLAMFLPVYFLWIFVACVTICSEHTEPEPDFQSINVMAELNGLDEADCCPITNPPASLAPERPSFSNYGSSDGQALTTSSTQSLSETSYYPACVSTLDSYSAPPSGRSCVLRI